MHPALPSTVLLLGPCAARLDALVGYPERDVVGQLGASARSFDAGRYRFLACHIQMLFPRDYDGPITRSGLPAVEGGFERAVPSGVDRRQRDTMLRLADGWVLRWSQRGGCG